MSLPSHLVLELMDAKVVLTSRDGVKITQQVLTRQLQNIAHRYVNRQLTYTEATKQAQTVLHQTLNRVLGLAQQKINQKFQIIQTPPQQIPSHFITQTSQRLGDYQQILTDFATHNDPNTSGYWATDPGLQNRIDLLAHDAAWRDYNIAIVAMAELEFAAIATATGVTPGYPTDVSTGQTSSLDIIYIWRTHPEESKTGPCEFCESQEGIIYTAEDVAGADMPAHPACCCDWDIETQEV